MLDFLNTSIQKPTPLIKYKLQPFSLTRRGVSSLSHYSHFYPAPLKLHFTNQPKAVAFTPDCSNKEDFTVSSS